MRYVATFLVAAALLGSEPSSGAVGTGGGPVEQWLEVNLENVPADPFEQMIRSHRIGWVQGWLAAARQFTEMQRHRVKTIEGLEEIDCVLRTFPDELFAMLHLLVARGQVDRNVDIDEGLANALAALCRKSERCPG